MTTLKIKDMNKKIRIKTTKPVDISHYSDREPNMKKLILELSNLKDDLNTKSKLVQYAEYAILGDPIVKNIYQTDEFGENVLDENGDPIVLETKTIENVKFLRAIPVQSVPFDDWFALKKLIESQLPETMSDTDKYETFIKEGIKQKIVAGGYYKGQLSLNDFE